MRSFTREPAAERMRCNNKSKKPLQTEPPLSFSPKKRHPARLPKRQTQEVSCGRCTRWQPPSRGGILGPSPRCLRSISFALFLLEKFSVPAMYVETQATLSLRFVMHFGLRDGLWRRCVARSSFHSSFSFDYVPAMYVAMRAVLSLYASNARRFSEGLCDCMSYTVLTLEDYASFLTYRLPRISTHRT